MKKRQKTFLFAAVCACLLLTGCGENKKSYEQAGKDLEQGSYEYALAGYLDSVNQGVELARSYRGAGLACLRLSRYEEAEGYFTSALNCDKVEKPLQQDLVLYRATAYLKDGKYDNALADCQILSQNFDNSSEVSFLTGCVTLAMDSYEEASREFEAAYSKDPTYDTAIRIYQVYLDRGMEADGTRYLEQALTGPAQSTEDHVNRGRVYYYMEDYTKAAQELIEASKNDSEEALLLLGMVYLAQHDTSNARAMYKQYISEAGESAKGYNGLALCDMEDGDYTSALANIESGIPSADTRDMQNLLFNEIVVYEKLQNWEEAYQKADEYCAMFPEDLSAAKELEFLKHRIE